MYLLRARSLIPFLPYASSGGTVTFRLPPALIPLIPSCHP